MKLYQLAPDSQSLFMSYLILTENRKVIVIDGGTDGFGKESPAYMPAAIRAILGIGEKDYFEIEAWLLSHAHTDHIYELAKVLNNYSEDSNFNIKNIWFDFPPIGEGWSSIGGDHDHSMTELALLKKGLSHYAEIKNDNSYLYENINGGYINSTSVKDGLTAKIDDITIDFLLTWSSEDKIMNSTSIVFKVISGDKSILFLGDTYIDNAERLLKTCPVSRIKADVVQLGHHGQSGPDEKFYKTIEADKSIRLWPSVYWIWSCVVPAIKSNETRSWFGLPENNKEFEEQGLQNTGKDYVVGLYKHFPSCCYEYKSWTPEVISEALVFEN